MAAGGSCGRPRLEEPPREWDSEASPPKISGILEKAKAHREPKKAPEDPKALSFVTPNPWSALPREVYVGKGRGKKEGATTESPVDGQDQPRIYTIRDHTSKS